MVVSRLGSLQSPGSCSLGQGKGWPQGCGLQRVPGQGWGCAPGFELSALAIPLGSASQGHCNPSQGQGSVPDPGEEGS